MMHLQSKLWVRQNIELVSAFFHTHDNLAKWKKTAAHKIPVTVELSKPGLLSATATSKTATINYEYVESSEKKEVSILLINAGIFKKASWHFEFAPSGTGTDISCHVYFTVKFPFQLLYPVLYFNKKVLSHKLS